MCEDLEKLIASLHETDTEELVKSVNEIDIDELMKSVVEVDIEKLLKDYLETENRFLELLEFPKPQELTPKATKNPKSKRTRKTE
jgi:beta-galactosidase beta subunit